MGIGFRYFRSEDLTNKLLCHLEGDSSCEKCGDLKDPSEKSTETLSHPLEVKENSDKPTATICDSDTKKVVNENHKLNKVVSENGPVNPSCDINKEQEISYVDGKLKSNSVSNSVSENKLKRTGIPRASSENSALSANSKLANSPTLAFLKKRLSLSENATPNNLENKVMSYLSPDQESKLTPQRKLQMKGGRMLSNLSAKMNKLGNDLWEKSEMKSAQSKDSLSSQNEGATPSHSPNRTPVTENDPLGALNPVLSSISNSHLSGGTVSARPSVNKRLFGNEQLFSHSRTFSDTPSSGFLGETKASTLPRETRRSSDGYQTIPTTGVGASLINFKMPFRYAKRKSLYL